MNTKKGRKKFSILQLSRRILQIVFFIFLPSLYISTLSGIKQIYLAVLHQSFSPALLPQVIEVIAIIPVTILFGRFFCGWMCAFGSFSDFIYLISHKLFKKKLKVSEQADTWMKAIKYVILAVLVVAVWSFNITLFSTSSPWDAFGMLAAVGKIPDFSFVIANLPIGFAILVGIIVASALIERFFCRYLCPMGAIFAISSLLRIGKIRKPSAQCGNCRMCTNNCAMGIPLYKMDVVRSGECIHCMKCITVCPRSNPSFTIAKGDIRPLIAGAATVATMTGMYYIGDFAINTVGTAAIATASQSASSSQSSKSSSANQLYKDGTYQGSGTGYGGGTTTVSVTLKGDKITNISTVSSQDEGSFYNSAYPTISQEIISNQSASVDAVSGATFSSNGIMGAVADALSQAKISGTSSSVASSVSAAISATKTKTPSTVSSSPAAKTSATSSSPAAVKKPAVSSAPSAPAPQKAAVATPAPAKSTSSAQSSSSQAATAVSGKYKDGTYQGSGSGFRGTTTVSVVVSGGKVNTINVVSYADTNQYFSRAYSGVSPEIISSQSSNVDAVSGATFSSNGIMAAVANALSKA